MKCFVSRHITEQNYPIRFMYREAPDNAIDSGWRFLSGFEDKVFINDADNILLRDLGEITRIDPAVIPFLGCCDDVAFERLAEKECFTAVN